MKKRFLGMMLICAVLLSISASAVYVPFSAESGAEAIEPFHPEETVIIVPERFGQDFWNLLLTDMSAIPWDFWHDVHVKAGEDPFHSTYSFYTSKGCEDIYCQDAAHVHWCPNDICQNSEHGHSAAEYARAAATNPPCPCHKHG